MDEIRNHDGKIGDEFSAGVMFANAGIHRDADFVSMSKTIMMTLKAKEKVYLAVFRNAKNTFPYDGRYITFCASLLLKEGTKVKSAEFVGETEVNPVLGVRTE